MRRLIAWAVGGEPELGLALLARYAFAMGALAGLGEALYRTIWELVKHQPAAWYNPDVIWMAPAATALACVLIAAVLGVVARLGRTGVGLYKATFLFAFPGVYGITHAPGISLHPWAELVLSLGVSAAIARWVERRRSALPVIRRATLPAALGLAVLGGWGIARVPAVAERRLLDDPVPGRTGMPNVLLIILDTVRAANLGLYGYHRPTSPNLDGWATTGVVFDRALSTAPWTLPSHASMFTGHYNVTARTAIDRPLDGRLPTLAEVLRDHGYATAAFTANLGYTTRASGLHRGFVRFEDFPLTTGMFLRSAWLPNQLSRHLSWLPGFPGWPIPKTAEHITDTFEAWIAQRRGRPFFAFLNYYDAHGPYLAPPAYRTRFGPVPEEEATSERQWTTAELATSINAYDGSIAYLDDQLARVFATLERAGLRQNTLVVLTSDHGEMFGEHGQTAHTSGLYMPALHVPLVMVLPGAVPGAARVATPVTLRDLPATILDLAGLSAESPIPGQSLAVHWKPDAPARSASPLLAELDTYDWAPAWAPIRRGDMKSLFDDRLHYIRNGDGTEELYEPAVDPAEANDLIAKPELQPALARFRAAMDSIFGRRTEHTSR